MIFREDSSHLPTPSLRSKAPYSQPPQLGVLFREAGSEAPWGREACRELPKENSLKENSLLPTHLRSP